MPSGKDQLYMALYFHEREDTYHWALLLSPKSKPDSINQTTRYHVTNVLENLHGSLKETWKYEQRALPSVKTAKLLVKVLFGKVEKSRSAFEESVKAVAVVQNNPEWRCRHWVMAVISRLERDKILSKSSIQHWPIIEAESRAYVRKKEDEGRFKSWTNSTPKYDLMARKEIVP